jgi:16S rRNA (uracil1498-N3)-methyltransferase
MLASCFAVLRKIGNDNKVRLHRVHTDQALEPGCDLVVGEGRAHYLARVLRVRAGQSLVLFNGDGHDYVAEVADAGKKEIRLAVTSRLPAVRESPLKITVVQAVSRGERMDQTLQKCTELGAAAFQPVFSERVEVRLSPGKAEKRLEHWRAVVISACEQSGRAVVPPVLAPLTLADWLDREPDSRRLVLAPGAERPLSGLECTGPLSLAAGPEGGFSESELSLMRSREVLPVSMGPRILRTETAAAAAVAILQAQCGDLA